MFDLSTFEWELRCKPDFDAITRSGLSSSRCSVASCIEWSIHFFNMYQVFAGVGSPFHAAKAMLTAPSLGLTYKPGFNFF